MTLTSPKIDKITTPHAICIMPFTGDEFGTIREGDRVTASDPVVKKHGQFFVADGLSTAEVTSIRTARFPGIR